MADAVSQLTEQLAHTGVGDPTEDVLSFQGQGLKLDTADQAAKVTAAIKEKSGMKVLRFEGNTVGVEAAEAIGEALNNCSNLQQALWSDMFTGRLKTEIAPALKHLTGGLQAADVRLTVLDLSDNAFGPNGVPGFTGLLKSPCCFTLKELKLNNNGLGVTGGKMLAETLSEAHAASVSAGSPLSLRVFISGRGRLENEGSAALAKAFKAIGTLEEVSMPQNGINAPGIAALAEALSHNPRLRVLNLNDNTFAEAGAQAMARALPKMQQLEVINFGDCLLRTGGAKRIAAALSPTHAKLRELNMGFNEIKQSGAVAVAEAVENKTALEKLNLDGNQLGEDGKEVLMGTMEAIDKLELLESLSDDEGTDDEGDDEDDDDEEGAGDGEDVIEKEGDISAELEDLSAQDVEEGDLGDPGLHVRGRALTPSQSGEATGSAGGGDSTVSVSPSPRAEDATDNLRVGLIPSITSSQSSQSSGSWNMVEGWGTDDINPSLIAQMGESSQGFEQEGGGKAEKMSDSDNNEVADEEEERVVSERSGGGGACEARENKEVEPKEIPVYIGGAANHPDDVRNEGTIEGSIGAEGSGTSVEPLRCLESLEQLQHLGQLAQLGHLGNLQHLGQLGYLQYLQYLQYLPYLAHLQHLQHLVGLQQLASLQNLAHLATPPVATAAPVATPDPVATPAPVAVEQTPPRPQMPVAVAETSPEAVAKPVEAGIPGEERVAQQQVAAPASSGSFVKQASAPGGPNNSFDI